MKYFFMLAKALVRMTPTEKDDAALLKIEKFLLENPEVEEFFDKLLTKKSV